MCTSLFIGAYFYYRGLPNYPPPILVVALSGIFLSSALPDEVDAEESRVHTTEGLEGLVGPVRLDPLEVDDHVADVA